MTLNEYISDKNVRFPSKMTLFQFALLQKWSISFKKYRIIPYHTVIHIVISYFWQKTDIFIPKSFVWINYWQIDRDITLVSKIVWAHFSHQFVINLSDFWPIIPPRWLWDRAIWHIGDLVYGRITTIWSRSVPQFESHDMFGHMMTIPRPAISCIIP